MPIHEKEPVYIFAIDFIISTLFKNKERAIIVRLISLFAGDGFFRGLLSNGKILEKMNDFGSDFSYFLLLESRIFKVSSQIMSKERINKSCENVQFHEKEKLHRLNYIQKIDTKYMYLSNS